MKILCHRGYWKDATEKNSVAAFQRGFNLGLGTETDIRDCNGSLVISHDPAVDGALLFSEFLKLVPSEVTLALNVKADGIVDQAVAELKKTNHKNYFFFDMSVPDMLNYLNKAEPVAIRLSEYEPFVSRLVAKTSMVWLDAFDDIWYDFELLNKMLKQGLEVIVVSAELHGRSHEQQWALLDRLKSTDRICLCTDLPEQALMRFNC